MQIREHGRQLLMIRTNYVPEKKRTVPVTVAKQDKWLSKVSDEVRQQLTKEEVEQLESWLSSRAEKESVERLESSLSVVEGIVCRAAEALSVESLASGLSSDKAAAIYASMDALAKALRKAGHKKPARQAKEALPAMDERQLPLDNA